MQDQPIEVTNLRSLKKDAMDVFPLHARLFIQAGPSEQCLVLRSEVSAMG